MQIKCVKCSTQLKLSKMPESGNVKCPNCSAVLKLALKKKTPAPAKTRVAPAIQSPSPTSQPIPSLQPSAPSAPEPDPLAVGSDTPADGDFDFADIPEIPNQPVQGFQPSDELTAYTPLTAQPVTAPAPENPQGGDGLSGLVSGKAVAAGASIVVGLLLLVSAVVGVSMIWPASVETDSAAVANVPQAPVGFELVEFAGVSVHMPVGSELERYPSSIECKANMTPMGNVFMLASTAGGGKPLEINKLTQKIRRLLGGGVLAGAVCERSGVSGHKGVLDQSIFFPKLHIEMFQDEGRTIVIGVSAGANTDAFGMNADAEPEKQKVFYDSFKIGPKPAGSFW